MQPLQGIHVLDLTRLLPGGFCTLVLADLGADVLKVEEPGRGDYLRAFPPLGATQSVLFTALNRGKRSLALNLKAAEGRAALLDLVRGADVLVESFRPGVLARLGLGEEALRAANPRLIVCSISGYGQRGPLRGRAGHDLNYLGEAGALGLFAPRGGGTPVVPGLQLADLGGGALTAALGILAALIERQRTGQGRTLDISMTDGVLHWLALAAAELWATGDTPGGGRGPLSGGYACYSVYATADGRTLTVAAVEPQFWAPLCAMLGRPGYAALQYAPWPEQQRMFADLDALFRTRTLAEWLAFFGDAEVCVGPARSLAEALEARADRLIQFDQPGEGRVTALGGLFGVASDRPAPALGQHSRETLAALGYPPEQIEALCRTGVVQC
ncbi:MAG TPA: CaiB/BaiF CoA-transferase family protein [Roseiflexaceae bacterium]|nr:CaiB/BaiF CoA-transferase family protein [Roseiflexaceae bacterium]